jgi:hypothetical protein
MLEFGSEYHARKAGVVMTSFSIAVPRTSVFGDFLEILPANDPSQPGHIQDLQLRGKFQLRFANRLSEPIQIPGLVRVVQISTDRFVLTYFLVASWNYSTSKYPSGPLCLSITQRTWVWIHRRPATPHCDGPKWPTDYRSLSFASRWISVDQFFH